MRWTERGELEAVGMKDRQERIKENKHRITLSVERVNSQPGMACTLSGRGKERRKGAVG